MANETPEGERLQRAAIIGQIAGGILHDFNNVLTVITGMIDILAEGVVDKPQLAGAVKLIDEAAKRAAVLTSRLLAFARGLPARPCEVDVNALLHEAIRLLRPTLGGIEIALKASADVPPVLVDPGHLTAAILSLAIAARNAMPQGGKLTLGAATARSAESFTAAHASEPGEVLAITVDAHGYGGVAGHPERISIDVDTARDFINACGGRLAIGTPSDGCAQVRIFLPKATTAQPWLADG